MFYWLRLFLAIVGQSHWKLVWMQVEGLSFSWKNRLSNLSWHHCFTLFFSRSDGVFGRRRMSWLLPSSYYSSKLKEPTQPERDRLVAIILHLIFCTSYCVSLPKHRSVSVPCDLFGIIFLLLCACMLPTFQLQPPAQLWCRPVWCPVFCSTDTAR